MDRLTPAEIGIVVLAFLAILVGVDMTFFPRETVVIHQVYRSFGYNVEHVSKNGSQIYGVLCILFGVVLMKVALSGKRK